MKNKLVLSTIFLFTCFNTVFAQKTYTGNEAADWIQSQRYIANPLIDSKSTPAEVEKAVKILERTITFMDSLPIKQLAAGNAYLYYRRSDVSRDIASGYTLLGKKDQALNALDMMLANGTSSGTVDDLENEPTLDGIRKEPRYQAIIKKLKEEGVLWKNTAFKTPYKPNLSDAEKVAGLSLLWSQAKFNFANFALLDIDWNQTYLDYIPKVQATKSTAEYYKVLINFYAQLKDGHTNVYVPDSLAGEFYSRPPFRTELIEGRVFVVKVFSDSLLKSGIVPGLEVTKIDGQPVIDYAEKNVKPYASSSTPQDMEIREFSYQLLGGSKNKPIEFKDKKGKLTNRTISRTGYHDVKGLKSIDYQSIGGVGYLTINNFEDNKITKQFDSLYNAEISKTKGLIIDIRYNGGGDDGIAFHIIKYLTDKPFFTAQARILEHRSTPDAEPSWDYRGIGRQSPNGKEFYSKPVVVLVGPRTFSAAEDFTVAFDYMKRGKLIGMATGGSTGQPVPFSLPGGGSARVCGKHDAYPDGKEFVGVGIMPDIAVKPTIKDIQNGRDAAKEKALEILNK
ncbi:S41 family peptidase [Mucilaginibacter sp. BT774]|uniref:S41 family peptidase n=1 Tax=Mucilaginibacter sp. BT774 TaxID=3062276 RepID=UPI002675CA46|nr:S41 family peptidase [Mucilaginibacter sp. BT774]MDO3624694.1 S41 family peptidase [Mucilaginibacter sp. BT774]